jgi:hypothetical protein
MNSTFGEKFWLDNVKSKVKGGVGMTYRQESDIVFAGMMMSLWRYLHGDIITPHITDYLVFLRPKSKLKPFWTNILRPFDVKLWCAVCFVYILISLTYFMLVNYTGVRSWSSLISAFFLSWKIMFQPIEEHWLSRRTLKMFCVFTWIYVVIITTAYQSSILIVLTTQFFYPELRTVQDLVSSDLHLYLPSSNMNVMKTYDLPYIKDMFRPGKYSGYTPADSYLFDVIARHHNISVLIGKSLDSMTELFVYILGFCSRVMDF